MERELPEGMEETIGKGQTQSEQPKMVVHKPSGEETRSMARNMVQEKVRTNADLPAYARELERNIEIAEEAIEDMDDGPALDDTMRQVEIDRMALTETKKMIEARGLAKRLAEESRAKNPPIKTAPAKPSLFGGWMNKVRGWFAGNNLPVNTKPMEREPGRSMEDLIPKDDGKLHEGTSQSYAEMLAANRIKTEEAKNPPELSEELIEPVESIGEADMAPLDEEDAEDLPESAVEEAGEGDMKKTG